MILHRRTQRTGVRRLALAGGAVAAALVAWWLSGGASSSGESNEAAADRPASAAEQAHVPAAAAPLAVTPPVAAAAVPAGAVAPPPIQYVGQWMEGSRRTVLLGYQGRNVVVRVPGRVDERYEVVSADDRELVLRDRASASTQRVALGAAAPTTAYPGTAASPTPAEAPVASKTEAPAAPVRPDKLPPPSRRTSDDSEPEN